MKKYVKPELFFENYELSQHIAACAWDLNLTNDTVCGFKGDLGTDGEGLIILNDVRICRDKDKVEFYCYQGGPGDGYNIFNS